MPIYIPKGRTKINPRIERFRFYPDSLDRAFCSTFFMYWYALSSIEKRYNLTLGGSYDPVFASHVFCTILLSYIFAPFSLLFGVACHFLSLSSVDWVFIASVIIFNLLIPALIVYLRFGAEGKRERMLKNSDRDWNQSKANIVFPAIGIHIASAISLFTTIGIGANLERILNNK